LQPHPTKQLHHAAPSSSRCAAVLCRVKNIHHTCKSVGKSYRSTIAKLAAKPVVVWVWAMCDTFKNFSMINYSFVHWLL
jgi:hypothetical protein